MNTTDNGSAQQSRGVLFIPVTSGKGVGEYSRCLMLANALHEKHPRLPISFIIAKNSIFASSCPYTVVPIDGSPVKNTEAIIATIESSLPRVVVFDSTGRAQQLRAAKKAGAATVFISSRRSKRSKGMRLRQLRLLNAHWHVQPRWVDGDLSWFERLKLRLATGCEFQFLDSFFPPPDESALQQAKQAVGLENDEPFVLFASGGGGRRQNGPHAPDIFLAAAEQLANRIVERCVVVMGPAAEKPAKPSAGNEKSKVLTIRALPTEQFVSLLSVAQSAVIGGGSTISQALAMGRCCVAAPAGSDQPHRIEMTANAGLLVASRTEAHELAEKAYQLVVNTTLRQQLLHEIAVQQPKNGLPIAVARLADMAGC